LHKKIKVDLSIKNKTYENTKMLPTKTCPLEWFIIVANFYNTNIYNVYLLTDMHKDYCHVNFPAKSTNNFIIYIQSAQKENISHQINL